VGFDKQWEHKNFSSFAKLRLRVKEGLYIIGIADFLTGKWTKHSNIFTFIVPRLNFTILHNENFEQRMDLLN
jgi:hypothetical protein